jgi:hypothetical protein
MSATPLSDFISALVADSGPGPLRAFHEVLMTSDLGVQIIGAPADAVGEYRVAAGDNIRITLVATPDGRIMVKACADPRVFVQRYNFGINATISGRRLLEMVLKVPESEGVLVCSAASAHSVPIGRAEIAEVLRLRPPRSKRPWWKLW